VLLLNINLGWCGSLTKFVPSGAGLLMLSGMGLKA